MVVENVNLNNFKWEKVFFFLNLNKLNSFYMEHNQREISKVVMYVEKLFQNPQQKDKKV